MPATGETVSVVVPCFNQSRFLGEAIESVLAQTYPHVELIVVDDGSADDTPEVCARYAGRALWLRKENAGLSAARNSGILAASGEFLLFLDADDYLMPDTLERHMEVARRHPRAAVFHGGWMTVDEAGQPLRVRRPEAFPADAFHALLMRSRLVSHAAMVRRSALAYSGLYDVRIPACEDWDLWLRVAAAGGEYVPVPDCMVAYRRYPGTMSTDFERMWHGGLAVLKKNLAHHPHCVRCRRAAARGRWFLARYCLPLLLPSHTQEQGASLTYRRLLLASLRSPRLGALILWHASRHTVVRPLSACLAQARRSLPDSLVR